MHIDMKTMCVHAYYRHVKNVWVIYRTVTVANLISLVRHTHNAETPENLIVVFHSWRVAIVYRCTHLEREEKSVIHMQ